MTHDVLSWIKQQWQGFNEEAGNGQGRHIR